jgi:hypothetical protein
MVTISFIVGCTKSNSIEDKIKDNVEKDCKNANCAIIITNLTDFQWDKMYVFNNPTAPDEIDQAIGLNYPYYVEFTRTIVFLNKNKIVHYENHHSKAEGPTDGEVLFKYPDSLKYQVYKPGQSTFKVKQKTSKDISYYVLFQ